MSQPLASDTSKICLISDPATSDRLGGETGENSTPTGYLVGVLFAAKALTSPDFHTDLCIV